MQRSPSEKPVIAALPALDFDLGQDIELLRDAVQQFAAREIAPRAAQTDERNEFPTDLWRKLGSLGVLGITGLQMGASQLSERAVSRLPGRNRRQAHHRVVFPHLDRCKSMGVVDRSRAPEMAGVALFGCIAGISFDPRRTAR